MAGKGLLQLLLREARTSTQTPHSGPDRACHFISRHSSKLLRQGNFCTHWSVKHFKKQEISSFIRCIQHVLLPDTCLLTLRIPSTWGRLHCLQLMFTVEVSTYMNCKHVFRIFRPQDRPKSALSELVPKFDMTCQSVLSKLTRTKVPACLASQM